MFQQLWQGDAKGSARGGDGSSKREAVGGLPAQNAQVNFCKHAIEVYSSVLVEVSSAYHLSFSCICDEQLRQYALQGSMSYISPQVILSLFLFLSHTF